MGIGLPLFTRGTCGRPAVALQMARYIDEIAALRSQLKSLGAEPVVPPTGASPRRRPARPLSRPRQYRASVAAARTSGTVPARGARAACNLAARLAASGWLEKEGSRNKSMRRRWFELNGGTLTYSERKGSATKG